LANILGIFFSFIAPLVTNSGLSIVVSAGNA